MPYIFLRQSFGTGGSPSVNVTTILVTSQAITTSWAKYTYTVTLPSVSGKTLGTDNNDCLIVMLLMPVNTTFTFDLAQVQLEAGPVATPFERRPVGTELALCERYYQVLVAGLRADSYVTTGGSITLSCTYAPMRAVPTLVGGAYLSTININTGPFYSLSTNILTTGGNATSTGMCSFTLASIGLNAEL